MEGFYYIDKVSHQQYGPFSSESLRGKIQPDTPVWKTGMGDWAEAQNVSELGYLFDANHSQSGSQASDHQFAYQPPLPPQGGQYAPFNQNQMEVRPKPDNWLVLSILATLFCCIPFGIVGIINASKVDGLYYNGDYDGAARASDSAKKWVIAAAISFLVIVIFYFLFFMAMGSL